MATGAVVLAQAADKPATAPAAREIRFDELAYYFVKNTFEPVKDRPMCAVFAKQEAFDEVFGVGMVMGADRSKLLNPGDFDRHMAVSVMQPGNDIREIRIRKIRLEGKTLIVEFTNEVKEANASWSGVFHSTVRMERCEFTSVRLIENGKVRADIPVRR
jgi:hypothetical protein